MENKRQVVVLGAGYAGLLATVRLAGKMRKQDVAIALVNGSDLFVERLRLHQYAANQPVAARPISDVLNGTGVAFVRGIATHIDAARHEVIVERGAERQRLTYDKMIYALGSTIERDSVPGVREYAYTLTPSGIRSAVDLRQVLPSVNAQGGRLLVIGGGATGIEAAAEFAASYPNLNVQLITRGAFGLFLNKPIATYMRQSLNCLGVTIRDHTTVTQIEPTRAVTAAGATITYDLCLWTGGFTVPTLAREAGLAVNERGQVLIDPFMRSISHPDIFAVGDAAYPVEDPGVRVRMAALTAVIMGAHGADSLAVVLKGKPPQPFSFAYLGQAVALGPHNAIAINNYPDDKPKRPYLTGRVGYEGREFFVRLLADLPNIEKRLPGATVWLGKGRYAAAKRQAKRLMNVKQV